MTRPSSNTENSGAGCTAKKSQKEPPGKKEMPESRKGHPTQEESRNASRSSIPAHVLARHHNQFSCVNEIYNRTRAALSSPLRSNFWQMYFCLLSHFADKLL